MVRLLLAVAAIGITLWAAARYIKAQSPLVHWSVPTDISNTPYSSAYPAIVADNFGYVHVLWSVDTNGQPLGPHDPSYSGNTIFYTRWTGSAWTEPVDVLYLSDDPVATYVSVAVDKDGYLHAVWTGTTNIYYSKAPVWQAESAHAWSPPAVITTNSARSAWESSIAVDNAGALHIVYATRGSDAGVYHVESTDGGATWSSPTKISQPFDSLETSFSRVKIISDSAGRLHAVWDTTNIDGFGQSIYYARSVDNGVTWADATQMAYLNPGDFDVGWPYIAVVGADELHLIYNAAANVGRWERISRDGGTTWSQAQFIIPEMEGINGYTIPLVDGNGQLHLIIDMRPSATQKVGIYYSDWQGDRWSPVVPLTNDGPMAETAHYVAATVLSGDEIHVVWNQVRGGEIWHIQGTLDAVKPLPTWALPTLAPTSTPTPTALAISSPIAAPVYPPLSQTAPPNANTASDSPLIPSTIAVIGFIGLIIIAARRRQAHEHTR
jgi:hypothetical protein